MKPTLILSFGWAMAPVAARAATAAPAKAPKTFPENILAPSRLDFHQSVAGLKPSGKNSPAYTSVRLTPLCSSVRHEGRAQGSRGSDGAAMPDGQEQQGDDRGQIRHRRQYLRRHSEL